MSDKKSKKKTSSADSKPSKKSKRSKSRKSAEKCNTKMSTKKKVKGSTPPAATATVETILIAPSDYVPIFHRELKEYKAPESKSVHTSANLPSTTFELSDKGSTMSKNTLEDKSIKKGTSVAPKSQKGPRSKSKKSSKPRQVKSARPKKAKLMELQLQPKLAKYVVQALNGRMDIVSKQYDHNCSKQCNCPTNKAKKSKKKKSKSAEGK